MAINYTKIGWDTSKYVNPTNMNQMDNGIKAACDGVDGAVMRSNAGYQQIANTANEMTALAIKSGNATKCFLALRNSSGNPVGLFGAENSIPYFRTAGGVDKELALVENVIRSSYAGTQLLTNTDTSSSVVLALKTAYPTTSANQAIIRFINSANEIIGYLGVREYKPYFLGTNGVYSELARVDTLKSVVAASTDFADFKARMAAL